MSKPLLKWNTFTAQIWSDRVMALPEGAARHKVASLVYWDFQEYFKQEGALFDLVMRRDFPPAEDCEVLEMLVQVGYPKEVAAKRLVPCNGYHGQRNKLESCGDSNCSVKSGTRVGPAALLYEVALKAIEDLNELRDKGVILKGGEVVPVFPNKKWKHGIGDAYQTRGDLIALVKFFTEGTMERMCNECGLDLNHHAVMVRLGFRDGAA